MAFRFAITKGYVIYMTRSGASFKLVTRNLTRKTFADLGYRDGLCAAEFDIALRRATTPLEVRKAVAKYIKTPVEEI